MGNNLRWICENEKVEIETIMNLEATLGVKFPRDYVEVVMQNDGAYPKPNRFDLNGNEEVFNNLLSFSKDDSCYIVDTYNYAKDRLIDKIVPFAEDPFGNLICFDFRNISQPCIVFWEHEKAFSDKNSAIVYLCDSFTELLQMLHQTEE